MEIENELNKLSDPKKAKILAGFFKTAKGEYGEGDVFIGVTVPNQRLVAKKYIDADLATIQKLLKSKIHEHRLTALLILTYQYPKASVFDRKRIIDFYLKNTKCINNWDLVDLSAPKLLGQYIFDNPDARKIIYKLVQSNNVWEKRIAVLSTFILIRNGEFEDTLKIAKNLLLDGHDLIHKAVGWMLREIGKRDQSVEEEFLKKHYKVMPRTMLRYAIERFDNTKKDFYMGRKTILIPS